MSETARGHIVIRRKAKDGEPGSWTSFVFKASLDGTKPATPTSRAPIPPGWSDTPPIAEAIVNPSCTGDWRVSGNILESNHIEDDEETWERIRFETSKDHTLVAIRITASTEEDYDWGYLWSLDTPHTSGGYAAKVSGNESRTIAVDVFGTGSHFIDVGYVKDTSLSERNDKITVELLDASSIGVAIFMSKATVTNGIAGIWSEPIQFNGDDGEKGPRPEFLTYRTGYAYKSGAKGEGLFHIVYHVQHEQFFRCLRSYPASETHSPTESATNAYWEYLPGIEQLIVEMLCANNAFLNNLVVRHMYTADGKCQILEGGYLKAVSAVIEGYIETTLVPKSNSFTISDQLNIATYGGFYSQVITLPSNPSFISKRVTICNTNYPPYTKTSLGYYTTIAVDNISVSNGIGIAGNVDVEARSQSAEPANIRSISVRGGVVEFLGVPASWGDQTYCRWVLISGHRSVMYYETM